MNCVNVVCYGEVGPYGLVFVSAQVACRLARIHWAIGSSRTWGQFADKVPPEVMDAVLGDEDRISFHNFCKEWLYQSLGWPDEQAAEWFTDAVAAYCAKPEHERYPLPDEECWASDALAEGYWPDFPPRIVGRWMPREIVALYGVEERCVHDDNYIRFDPAHKKAIIDELQKRGFTCVQNKLLVNLACGNGGDEGTAEKGRLAIESAEKQLPAI